MTGAVLMGTLAVAGLAAAGPAGAAGPAPRVFANCTQMHKVYPGGVARPGAVDKGSTAHSHRRPTYDLALYRANSKSDRDHDGIACEA